MDSVLVGKERERERWHGLMTTVLTSLGLEKREEERRGAPVIRPGLAVTLTPGDARVAARQTDKLEGRGNEALHSGVPLRE